MCCFSQSVVSVSSRWTMDLKASVLFFCLIATTLNACVAVMPPATSEFLESPPLDRGYASAIGLQPTAPLPSASVRFPLSDSTTVSALTLPIQEVGVAYTLMREDDMATALQIAGGGNLLGRIVRDPSRLATASFQSLTSYVLASRPRLKAHVRAGQRYYRGVYDSNVTFDTQTFGALGFITGKPERLAVFIEGAVAKSGARKHAPIERQWLLGAGGGI